jgi:hypothetical protein
MKRFRLPCCLALVLCTAGAGAQKFTFTLNGKPLVPSGAHLSGDPSKWTEGDVIFVEQHSVMLGRPGAWHFKWSRAVPNVLFLAAGGKELPVAAVIDEDYSGDEKVLRNPLETMPAAERAGLRGLTVDAPLKDLAGTLAGLNAAQVALSVTDDCLTEKSKALPALPATLTWLHVDEGSNQGIEDLAALKNLTALRGLRLDLMTVEPFDARLLSGMKPLRWLDLSAQDLTGLEGLSALTNLHTLDVSWHEKLNTVSWAGGLTALQSLRLTNTAVKDLSPLSALPALREIEAQNSPVEKLGSGGFPALRRLNLLATAVEADEAAAFRSSHPECEVLTGYHETLAAAVKQATRLRVRSGGTCHRNQAEERTLIEVKTAAEIADLVKTLKFEEDAEPFHCMCCGEPSFEFYAGDKLVAMLGFHHGQGMRWAGGPWPGDVHLENNSALRLCDWLEKHGVKGAGEELREQARQRAASKRRSALYRDIMSGELDVALREADSAEAAAKVFAEKLPDPLLRARVVFSLYGCTKDSWNLAAGMDEFIVEHLIPTCDREAIAKLSGEAGLSEAARRGLARWLFEAGAWEKFDKAILAKQLPVLAAAGLTSARSYNRHRTIAILGAMGTPEAVALLTKVLHNTWKPETLKPEETDEPGGMVSFHPDTLSLPDDAPDTAHAAVMLLRLKDEASAAAVEKTLAGFPAALRGKVQSEVKSK